MNSNDTAEHQQTNPSPLEGRVMDYVKAVIEKRDDEADGMLIGFITAAMDDAMLNPSPELVWINLAMECEEIGNWAAAEDARKKVLEIDALLLCQLFGSRG